MNRELLNKAVQAIVPLSVNLKSLEVKTHEEFDPDVNAGQELDAFFRFKPVNHEVFEEVETEGAKRNLVKFYFSSGVRLVPVEAKDPSKYVVELVADFVASYALVTDDIPDSECFVEFGKYNSPLHVWPYWRELINNMGGRFGFGQVVLPMYKIREEALPDVKTAKKKLTRKASSGSSKK